MIELLFTAGQWLGMLVFFYGACVVITCAAEEPRNMPASCGPRTTLDWDAPNKALENGQQRDSW
jgi:hypothetical protein